MSTKPDLKKFQSEKGIPTPKKLQDHHLFRILGGNPSIIVILAPMLSDSEHRLDLPALYKTLSEDQDILKGENDEDGMMTAIKASVHISVESLQNSDPDCMLLIHLLSMLPGGIFAKDLDKLWNSCKSLTETA